jgi:hypothetical protein
MFGRADEQTRSLLSLASFVRVRDIDLHAAREPLPPSLEMRLQNDGAFVRRQTFTLSPGPDLCTAVTRGSLVEPRCGMRRSQFLMAQCSCVIEAASRYCTSKDSVLCRLETLRGPPIVKRILCGVYLGDHNGIATARTTLIEHQSLQRCHGPTMPLVAHDLHKRARYGC